MLGLLAKQDLESSRNWPLSMTLWSVNLRWEDTPTLSSPCGQRQFLIGWDPGLHTWRKAAEKVTSIVLLHCRGDQLLPAPAVLTSLSDRLHRDSEGASSSPDGFCQGTLSEPTGKN